MKPILRSEATSFLFRPISTMSRVCSREKFNCFPDITSKKRMNLALVPSIMLRMSWEREIRFLFRNSTGMIKMGNF